MSNHYRSEILFIFGLLAALYVIYLARHVLLFLYVSALFAVVLSPAVETAQRIHVGRWRPGRGLALALFMLLLLGTLAAFLLFAIPPIFRDLKGLAEDWPQKLAGLTQRFRNLPFAGHLDPAALEQSAAVALGGAVGFFASLAGGLLGLFSGIILVAYFILDGEHAFYWIMSMVPHRQRDRLQTALLHAERRVRNWLVGQIALMLIMGSCSAIVFRLLRLKYFYALALFAGLANIVPFAGAAISGTLAGLVALIDSPAKMLGVGLFYVVYYQIESAILTPHIMKSTVDLPPLAIIIALAIGAGLAGILGALVAVPTAGIIAALLEEYAATDQPA